MAVVTNITHSNLILDYGKDNPNMTITKTTTTATNQAFYNTGKAIASVQSKKPEKIIRQDLYSFF